MPRKVILKGSPFGREGIFPAEDLALGLRGALGESLRHVPHRETMAGMTGADNRRGTDLRIKSRKVSASLAWIAFEIPDEELPHVDR